jgi:hypothetical protein
MSDRSLIAYSTKELEEHLCTCQRVATRMHEEGMIENSVEYSVMADKIREELRIRLIESN